MQLNQALILSGYNDIDDLRPGAPVKITLAFVVKSVVYDVSMSSGMTANF